MAAPADRHDHEQLHARAASDAVNAAIARLRQQGERVTAPRRAVLEVLAGRSDHLTADEVSALLEGNDVHRATVYRTLDVLSATGVVSHRHAAGGATRYHLAATVQGAEHLHGHCLGCGTVVVLPADALDAAAVRLQERSGFRLDIHQSTLTGLCEACAR
jgi:Fur family ferric uptake transcriptional regulator